MKKASWILLAVVGALTLLGSLVSLGVAFVSRDDQIGPATLTELSAGKPEVATALRARRATAAAYGAGFVVLFLLITIGPYRRGDVGAWWTLLVGMLVVSALIMLRFPLLGVPWGVGPKAAAMGAGTAVSALIQLGVVGVGLALGAGRLRQHGPR
jgi:hypothetical protein